MNFTLTPKKAVAAAAALLAVIILIATAINGKAGGKQEPPIGAGEDDAPASAPPAVEYDISGDWHSDRDGGDVLTFAPSGSYTSSSWLQDGSYKTTGRTVTLTDTFGKSIRLYLVEVDEGQVLRYRVNPENIDKVHRLDHDYHRTEQLMEDARARWISEKEAADALNRSRAMRILTTGDWESDNGTATLRFTEGTLTATYLDSTPAIVEECEYSITSVKAGTGSYEISLAQNLDAGFGNILIEIKNDNAYNLTRYMSGRIGDGFRARHFHKTVAIDFSDLAATNPAPPSLTPAGARANAGETGAADPLAEAEGPPWTGGKSVVVNEDGSVSRYTRIADDDPRILAHKADLFAQQEESLPGTWKGTVLQWPEKEEDYRVFVFKANGEYSFTTETGVEKGAWVLAPGVANRYGGEYGATLVLTPVGGEAKSLGCDFYKFQSGDEWDELSLEPFFEDFTDTFYPAYYKQK